MSYNGNHVAVPNGDSSGHWDTIHQGTSGELEGEKLHEYYDGWCNNYNQDLIQAGYCGPRIGAERVARLVSDKDSRILDVGCGTGMVGEELSKLGFFNVDGADISKKSLDVARATGCYRNLKVCDILNIGFLDTTEEYDVAVCVGAFIPGHLNQSVFPELCRVVKSGGYIIVVLREEFVYTAPEMRGSQLDSAAIKLCEEGVWHYVIRERVDGFLGAKPGVAFVFKKR